MKTESVSSEKIKENSNEEISTIENNICKINFKGVSNLKSESCGFNHLIIQL